MTSDGSGSSHSANARKLAANMKGRRVPDSDPLCRERCGSIFEFESPYMNQSLAEPASSVHGHSPKEDSQETFVHPLKHTHTLSRGVSCNAGNRLCLVPSTWCFDFQYRGLTTPTNIFGVSTVASYIDGYCI